MKPPRLSVVGAAVVVAACAAFAGPLAAQTDGAIAGRVREAAANRPVAAARVEVLGTGLTAETDTAGAFRVAPVRAGTYVVEIRAVGYAMARFRNVTVIAGETYPLDAALQSVTVVVDSVVVTTAPDQVLDPLATETTQRITADEFRRLPVSSIAEALALSAGAVGE